MIELQKKYDCADCGEKVLNLSQHYRKCEQYQQRKNSTLSKGNLEKLYIEQALSLPKISEMLGFSVGVIHRAMKNLGIDRRDHSSAFRMSNDERKSTFMEKTGFHHNFCKGSPSRAAWEQRLLNEEGISNVFQRKDVKDKSKATMLAKYGQPHPMQVPKIARKVLGHKFSKPHKKINDLLKEIGLEFQNEKALIDNISSKTWYYDIFVPELNLLIEVNGDYYHANPIKYLPSDILWLFHSGQKTANEIWKRDWNKTKLARMQGYRFMTIWEFDIKHFLDDIKAILISIKEMEYEDSKNSEN